MKKSDKAVEAWIQRDADGRLYMHFEKPYFQSLTEDSWYSHSYVEVSGTSLDILYKSLRPKSNPKHVWID